MSKQPNKWFEHDIFHDEQAICIYVSFINGKKTGKLLKSLAKNQFLLNLKFDTEQKRNAGGDMSFLICGPWPGGSFARLSKLFPKMVVFLPNFGDKMPADFQGQAPEFWESAKIFSHSFVNPFLDEYRNRNFVVEYIYDADYQLLFFPWCALFDQSFLNCGNRWWWSSGKSADIKSPRKLHQSVATFPSVSKEPGLQNV